MKKEKEKNGTDLYTLHAVGAMYVCTLYAILFLKLWSYIQVNMWCRISRGKTSSQGRMRRQSLSYNNLQCEKLNYRIPIDILQRSKTRIRRSKAAAAVAAAVAGAVAAAVAVAVAAAVVAAPTGHDR
ncbi:diacylglycerol O-acyltransferase 1 isoform X1 [Vespula squamosa]|uniref:Diacylglycerol O-acyltransferase 1 isoform X1 n=1 Tax=Vespula squamosa TaxID=30214 RepID=A0ABD2A0L6_VESSQ